MKNFRATYQVVGTSALKPSYEQNAVVVVTSHVASQAPRAHASGQTQVASATVRQLLAEEWEESVHALRSGSVKGVSFHRFTKLQTVALGGLLFVVSFVGLFL